jgi:hypothetical protein
LFIFSKLAQNAVHSAFAGFTNFSSGFVNNKPVMIPINYLNELGTRKINIDSDIEYLSMLASTGQAFFKNKRDT